MSERDLSPKQLSDLQDIARVCLNTLDGLGKILENFYVLGSPPRGVGAKTKRLWKRLRWEPEDVSEYRSRVTSNITLLNAFNGNITKWVRAAGSRVDLLMMEIASMYCKSGGIRIASSVGRSWIGFRRPTFQRNKAI